jgi:pimeloyl-ACP methyl ester carboxylesterase
MYKSLAYDSSIISEDMVDLGFRFSSSPGAQRAFLKTNRGTVNLFGFKRKAIDPIRRNLHRIAVPVLVLWGERDAIIPVRHAYLAKDSIPCAELEVIENCGHIPMIECPEDFNSAILKFLRER